MARDPKRNVFERYLAEHAIQDGTPEAADIVASDEEPTPLTSHCPARRNFTTSASATKKVRKGRLERITLVDIVSMLHVLLSYFKLYYVYVSSNRRGNTSTVFCSWLNPDWVTEMGS